MNLCMDTGCGVIDAPAWVREAVRHAMGPTWLPSVGKRTNAPKPRPKIGPWRGNTIIENRWGRYFKAQEEASRHPQGPIATNIGPAANPRDVIVIWRQVQPNGQTRDVVMSARDGSVTMRPDAAARMMDEIRCNHPNAEFVVLRDLHQFGGARLDRSGDVPVMRFRPWP